ncbi:iron-sulfur cluster assembly accessory protein [Coxiella endosymbiont of Amblyomma sculptum]|nr:iron-sulfur cluster assembly accessory protein [Coxiella endosymbiont of Amblyomma sculptum]
MTGGGCSGFRYSFVFDEVINSDDFVIKKIILQSSQELQKVQLQKQLQKKEERKERKENDERNNKEENGNGENSFCQQTKLVNLLIDPISLQYLEGAEIDYREDVSGAQFIIRNPNAKSTCGCGSSFAI